MKKRAANLPPRAREPSTPGKLTPEVLAGICKLIAEGKDRTYACAAHGVTDSALRKHRAAHEDVDAAVSLAEAAGAEWYRTQIATVPAGKDATDDWKRWAWLGERIHPTVLAPPKQRVESSGPDGGAQEIKHSGTVAIDMTEAVRIARQKGE
jgi:hypothetical protein